MNSFNSASLINLLGFTVGAILYALLLVMVVRLRKKIDFRLFTIGILGVLWNFGEFFTFFWRDFRGTEVPIIVTAVSFSALGFLPTVVMQNAKRRLLTYAAYALSIFATALHFQTNLPPSEFALQILTIGSLLLLLALFAFKIENKLVLATALIIFAVSALHLSIHGTENKSWLIELIAHQSSLPLALVILLQDYRFAFADLFLKRALSLILLALTAFGLYVFVAVPMLAWHETHDRNDVQAAVLVITLWMLTALTYSKIHQFAVWLVDKIILRRADYEKLRVEIAKNLERLDDSKLILDAIRDKLKPALTANLANWNEVYNDEISTEISSEKAEIFIPTTESPFYKLSLSEFAGGRHLLSDEVEMLQNIAFIAARRIDAVRVTHERYQAEYREQEFSKLATEAQLTALRSQINPHFLFNALTTIGYLIQTSPEKAFETLMRLTKLLRSVLAKSGEFSTLGEEIKLIEAYLEIEHARFESRLRVKINVPNDLEKIRIPTLILQPLVENAIKHGISKSKLGGEVEISAKLETENGDVFLKLNVHNSGSNVNANEFSYGVGLSNIENRLQNYYGESANLQIKTDNENGTNAFITIPNFKFDSKLI
jgi:two-component system, LytTR family, sensor kinase